MTGKKTRAAIKRTLVTEQKQRGCVDRGAMFPVPPPTSDVPVDYAAWLADIKKRIRQERLRAQGLEAAVSRGTHAQVTYSLNPRRGFRFGWVIICGRKIAVNSLTWLPFTPNA